MSDTTSITGYPLFEIDAIELETGRRVKYILPSKSEKLAIKRIGVGQRILSIRQTPGSAACPTIF